MDECRRNLSLDRLFYTFQNMAHCELLLQAHNYLTSEYFQSILGIGRRPNLFLLKE